MYSIWLLLNTVGIVYEYPVKKLNWWLSMWQTFPTSSLYLTKLNALHSAISQVKRNPPVHFKPCTPPPPPLKLLQLCGMNTWAACELPLGLMGPLLLNQATWTSPFTHCPLPGHTAYSPHPPSSFFLTSWLFHLTRVALKQDKQAFLGKRLFYGLPVCFFY